MPTMGFGANGITDVSVLNKYPYWTAVGTVAGLTPKNCRSKIDSFGGRLMKVRLWSDAQVKIDGKFSVAAWKKSVDRYRPLADYLNGKGAQIEHMLLDDIALKSRWGREIHASEIEELAAHSQMRFPKMITMMRAMPEQLDGHEFSALKVIQANYLFGRGGYRKDRQRDCRQWLARQQAGMAEFPSHMKLATAINWVNGGDGSSRQPGSIGGKYFMSADELREYGAILVPASWRMFVGWEWHSGGKYDASYFSKPTIRSAMESIRDLCAQQTWS